MIRIRDLIFRSVSKCNRLFFFLLATHTKINEHFKKLKKFIRNCLSNLVITETDRQTNKPSIEPTNKVKSENFVSFGKVKNKGE